jgi:hypothetical protein
MSDLRQSPPSRSAVVRKLEEAQEEAIRLIAEARLSDARASLAIRRIRQLTTSAFLELDETYRIFRALQKAPDQDAEYAHWANDRISWLLTQTERAIGEVVSAALRGITAEVANPKPNEVRKEVIVREVEPDWLRFLHRHEALLYVLALCVLGFFSSVVFGVLWLAIVLPIGWVVLFHKVRWLVLIPIGLLVLLWFYLTS